MGVAAAAMLGAIGCNIVGFCVCVCWVCVVCELCVFCVGGRATLKRGGGRPRRELAIDYVGCRGGKDCGGKSSA